MRAPSRDIAQRLVDLGNFGTLGGSADWSIYARQEPLRTPENAITVYDTPGFDSLKTMDPDETEIEQPSFQVRIRSQDYDTGWTKATQVLTDLHRAGDGDSSAANPGEAMRWDSDDGTARYLEVVADGPPLSLGQDGNNRWILIINFSAKRKAI